LLPVEFLGPAEKYFKKLKDKNLKEKYRIAIYTIRENPNIGGVKTGDLAGILGYDIYYQKTNYEIAYRVAENEQGELVVIIMAGTRENFWEAVKRYMKS
jgi:mRNA interferase RelE/StbE